MGELRRKITETEKANDPDQVAALEEMHLKLATCHAADLWANQIGTTSVADYLKYYRLLLSEGYIIPVIVKMAMPVKHAKQALRKVAVSPKEC